MMNTNGEDKMVNIFISHIHEESSIAKVLKDWIESTFSGHCIVFISSDSESITPGDKWLEKIDLAFENVKVFIVLCSPQSIVRPWVNFESGCAWIKRVPIIPICYGGLDIKGLPSPLSIFQAVSIDGPRSCKSIVHAIANRIGLSKLPRISYSEMAGELKEEISKVTLGIHLRNKNAVNLDAEIQREKDTENVPQDKPSLSVSEFSREVMFPILDDQPNFMLQKVKKSINDFLNFQVTDDITTLINEISGILKQELEKLTKEIEEYKIDLEKELEKSGTENKENQLGNTLILTAFFRGMELANIEVSEILNKCIKALQYANGKNLENILSKINDLLDSKKKMDGQKKA